MQAVCIVKTLRDPSSFRSFRRFVTISSAVIFVCTFPKGICRKTHDFPSGDPVYAVRVANRRFSFSPSRAHAEKTILQIDAHPMEGDIRRLLLAVWPDQTNQSISSNLSPLFSLFFFRPLQSSLIHYLVALPCMKAGIVFHTFSSGSRVRPRFSSMSRTILRALRLRPSGV